MPCFLSHLFPFLSVWTKLVNSYFLPQIFVLSSKCFLTDNLRVDVTQTQFVQGWIHCPFQPFSASFAVSVNGINITQWHKLEPRTSSRLLPLLSSTADDSSHPVDSTLYISFLSHCHLSCYCLPSATHHTLTADWGLLPACTLTPGIHFPLTASVYFESVHLLMSFLV